MSWLDSGAAIESQPVLLDHRQTSVGVKLLDTAYEWSIGEGLAGVFAILKLPSEADPKKQWHVNLYFQWSMMLTRLVVECGASIHGSDNYANPQVKFKGAGDLGIDDLCNLVLRSFESTRKFEYDPLVHDPAAVRAFLSEIHRAEGLYVAYLGVEAVGFVLARTPTGNNHAYEHIAAMGILPEHRGKKIGMSLLQKAHNYILEKGFEYSFVGTSESNLASRALYGKMSYQSVYRILKFVKATKATNIARDLTTHELNDLSPLEGV